MQIAKVRLLAGSLLLSLIAICMWLALKEESSLRVLPFIPNSVAVFLDNHFYTRNSAAFGLIGLLSAASIWGLELRWKLIALAFCLVAPLVKDLMQIPIYTRHFDWLATVSGLLGSIAGWVLGMGLCRLLGSDGSGGVASIRTK